MRARARARPAAPLSGPQNIAAVTVTVMIRSSRAAPAPSSLSRIEPAPLPPLLPDGLTIGNANVYAACRQSLDTSAATQICAASSLAKLAASQRSIPQFS